MVAHTVLHEPTHQTVAVGAAHRADAAFEKGHAFGVSLGKGLHPQAALAQIWCIVWGADDGNPTLAQPALADGVQVVEVALLAVRDQAVGHLVQNAVGFGGQRHGGVAFTHAVEQTQWGQGAAWGQHGVDQHMAFAQVQDQGGIAELGDAHGGFLWKVRPLWNRSPDR